MNNKNNDVAISPRTREFIACIQLVNDLTERLGTAVCDLGCGDVDVLMRPALEAATKLQEEILHLCMQSVREYCGDQTITRI